MAHNSSSNQPTTESDVAESDVLSLQSEPSPEPSFGWTQYAEQLNGRFAMIGFIALLLMELFTKQDFFSWIGIR